MQCFINQLVVVNNISQLSKCSQCCEFSCWVSVYRHRWFALGGKDDDGNDDDDGGDVQDEKQ